jgi:hypothetical protein
VNRIALVLLVLVSVVGCVAVAAAGMPVAKMQSEAALVDAEASLVDAESELVDSRSISHTQAALVQIAASAIANADAARSEAAGRADRIQTQYHELAIETMRKRRRSWWPWLVVAVVAATAAGVVLQSRRRPVVVVIRLNGDGVELVQLPVSGSDVEIIPAVMRPRSGHSAIRRV